MPANGRRDLIRRLEVKMSELTVVGTWLHQWFPRTHCLNKYYVVQTYTCYGSY